MKGRARWSRFTIALALIAALAIAAPAIGGPSLKKLVKKEVAKQIAKATGPAGANGTNGAEGTARAYARVEPQVVGACSPNCSVQRSKGVSTVTRSAVGIYCVHAPGIDPTGVPAVASPDFQASLGGDSAFVFVNSGCDSGTGFEVRTERPDLTTVDAAGDSTDTTDVEGVAFGDAVPADNVGFTIMIP